MTHGQAQQFSDGLLKFSQAKSQLIRSEQRRGSEGRTLRLTPVFLHWKQQSSLVVDGCLAVKKGKGKRKMAQSNGEEYYVKTPFNCSLNL